MVILWLLLATLYLKNPLSVSSHNSRECSTQICFEIARNHTTPYHITWYGVDNAYFCFFKSKHYTKHSNHSNIHYLCFYTPKKHIEHSFSTTQYHRGPPIKWWEDMGRETQKSNVFLNTIKHFAHTSLKFYPKNFLYDDLYRFTRMAEASSTKNMDVCVVEENEIINTSQKRTTSALVTIIQKKAKSKRSLGFNGLSLWLGFPALNHINKQKELPLESIETTRELLKKGIDFDEAKEMQSALPSFPYVPQIEWPSKREDGIEGQHFNLTQLPFDVEVDENGYSLDYQISIHFELKDTKWEKDIIMDKVRERLTKMNIKTGELIGEPIAIMCYHKSTTWSGTIKLHLENPVVDAKNLLQGTKAFILTLDSGKPWKGKVCKSYDMLALNNLLSVKIASDTLIGKEWYNIFEEIVNEGFDRKYDYEITNIQKKKEMSFAWVVATSPEQAKKISTYKISLHNEILDAKFTSKDKLTEDDKARKNALILIIRNLNKVKSTDEIEYGIKKHMGEKNVVNIFFKIENGKHIGSCNVQCLNAAVYKKFVKKNTKLLGKYIEFTPHPKSLDGINAPSPTELTKLGFSDVNTALASTVEALENAPSNGLTRQEVRKMVEGESAKLREEMIEREENAYRRGTIYTDNSMKSIATQLKIFKKQLLTTVDYIESVAKESEGAPHDNNDNTMDMSN